MFVSIVSKIRAVYPIIYLSASFRHMCLFVHSGRSVNTAIALKTDYDAKYGAPTSATPKVFVKWFYVNCATGEKSGEMMGLATLTA
jgi:hypothetical protein